MLPPDDLPSLPGENSFASLSIEARSYTSTCTFYICAWSAGVSCGSTDEWTLESTDKSGNESCGTGCGCA